MRITGFSIGGFGLLADLDVDGLGAGTTVVSGPNEAGKSTLHAFLVRTLFGHPRANDRRGRDRHEPLRGGRHGGVVHARDDDGGARAIHRHTTGSPVLRVVRPDGTESTTQDALAELLGRGVDERRFEQVFAIDLDALAGLGALGGDALDELLLDAATVGAGRSLRRAIATLEERRDTLWTSAARQRPLNAALAQRREAERRLRDARARAGSYETQRATVARLAGELERVRGQQARVDAERRRLARLKELWPTWRRLADAEERLADADGVEVPPELAQRVSELEHRRDEARQHAAEVLAEADRLTAARAR